jgi:Ca2+-binding EF-hand superfamily protein
MMESSGDLKSNAAAFFAALGSPKKVASASPEEHQAAVQAIFAMFDVDGDGALSEAEYKAYLKGLGVWGKKT